MLQNYVKIALRNLRKQPGYAAINVAGLAVGIACCILIVLFVRDELSYDRFHSNSDRLYRVVMDGQVGERVIHAPVTPSPMAQALIDEVPQVEHAIRVLSIGNQTLVRHEDRQFVESKFFHADSAFFSVFSFPLVQGDPTTALAEPNTVVLTESAARRYFPDGEAVGKTLTVDGNTDYRVTGILADIPSNTHVHFDLLGSFRTLAWAQNDQWISNNFSTYVVLRPGADPAQIRDRFQEFMRKYGGPQLEQFAGVTYEQFLESGNRFDYYLQPVTDIHLRSQLEFEIEPGGSMAYVYLFGAVALFLLLIACINFMNLATARSAGRAREVGMRKVLGSERGQLIRQFLSESIMMSMAALLLAVGLALALLPAFNAVSGKAIGASVFLQPQAILALLALGLLVGIIAGSYPAFFLSAFQPISVLKGKLSTNGRGTWLRRGLVVFQFAISITLVIGTLVVYDQLQYVRSKSLGFDKEHVVVVNRANQVGDSHTAFKDELRELPGVLSVGAASSIPSGIFGQTGYKGEGEASGLALTMSPVWVDHDFVETLGIEMAEGRDFSRDFASDTTAFIVNEAAVRKVGWSGSPIGQRLTQLGDNGTGDVIGVMRDFHFSSLHRPIDALAVRLASGPLNFIVVRVRPESLSGTLASIDARWREFVPEQPLDYAFLDQSFDAQYRSEERLGRIFTSFTLLAILIACLGLFGLASFAAQQRTKEIGVRKVMGATVPQIILLLSKEFTRLVAVAFIIAIPLAYFVMNEWLSGFAYRTGLSWWIFAVAGIGALMIALVTVSYQSVRAAVSNPVKSLRYE